MTGALPDHCTPIEQWLVVFSSAFHTCVPTDLAFVSTTLGMCSIISWLFAQVPQIYKNHKLKSASGLSIYFLAEWLLGDLTNLLGAILTDQAAWQIVVAAYYVTVDVCLVGQYIWYAHAQTWRSARLVESGSQDGRHHDDPDALLEGISPTSSDAPATTGQTKDKKAEETSTMNAAFLTGQQPKQVIGFSQDEKASLFQHSSVAIHHPASSVSYSQSITLMTLLCVALTAASPIQLPQTALLTSTIATHATSSPSHSSPAQLAGRILSWTSTALYLFSRLPQIYKNLHRRSTSGLSPTLFIAAFFGNLFYSASILANPLAWSSYPPHGLHGWVGEEGSDRWDWVGLAVPFWLGAAGVLIMDGIIGVQFLVYGEGEIVGVETGRLENGDGVTDDAGRERKNWQRGVTGWMRGWVPSPSLSLKPPQKMREEVERVQGTEETPLIARDQGGPRREERGYSAT